MAAHPDLKFPCNHHSKAIEPHPCHGMLWLVVMGCLAIVRAAFLVPQRAVRTLDGCVAMGQVKIVADYGPCERECAISLGARRWEADD